MFIDDVDFNRAVERMKERKGHWYDLVWRMMASRGFRWEWYVG